MYLVWGILLLFLVGAVLTALLPPAEDRGDDGVLGVLRRATYQKQRPGPGRHSDSPEEEQKFTIIIQTYNRTDVLLKLLNHYQAVTHLQQIIIVWNNIGKQTPLKLWNSLGPHPVPVVFKEQTSNRMRNRLQLFPEIDTDGQFIYRILYVVSIFLMAFDACIFQFSILSLAVLMLDDDTLVSVPDISFAFSVWKVMRSATMWLTVLHVRYILLEMDY